MREILKELNRNAIKNNEYSEWGAKRNRGENWKCLRSKKSIRKIENFSEKKEIF